MSLVTVYCFALVIMRVLTELIVKALGHMLGIIITGISTAIAAAFSRGRADRVNQRGVVRMTRSLPTNTRKGEFLVTVLCENIVVLFVYSIQPWSLRAYQRLLS